jgi:hypothetical protein
LPALQQMPGQALTKESKMGLDMYLYAREYLADYDWYPEEVREKYNNVIKTTEGDSLQYEGARNLIVEYEAMYWRKANAIHGWFVDNIQDGEDDCKRYPVSVENLKELVEVCQYVLANPNEAEEKLPTRSGFFFGGEQYDDWYFNNVEATVERLNKVIDIVSNKDNIYLQYISSW